MMDLQQARSGRIDYLRGPEREPWGYETWTATRNEDGSRTLFTHAELSHDGETVGRDCVQSVRADWHPIEAFIRITRGGSWSGSGWFRFTDDTVTLDANLADRGSRREELRFEGPLRGFGTHGLQADAWLAGAFPFHSGPGHRFFRPLNLTHSVHHLGATGPSIATTTSGLEFIGEEVVENALGSFRCNRVRFVGFSNDHPPYEMWVTAEDDPIYVRGEVSGYLGSSFELTSLNG